MYLWKMAPEFLSLSLVTFKMAPTSSSETKPKYCVTVRDRFTTSFTYLPSQKSRGLAGQVMHPSVSLCVVLQERNVVRIAQVTIEYFKVIALYNCFLLFREIIIQGSFLVIFHLVSTVPISFLKSLFSLFSGGGTRRKKTQLRTRIRGVIGRIKSPIMTLEGILNPRVS